MPRILMTGAAGGIGNPAQIAAADLSGPPAQRHQGARRSRPDEKFKAADLADLALRGDLRGCRRHRPSRRPGDRGRLGDGAARPTSSAATICSRPRAARASSAWCSLPPTTSSASIPGPSGSITDAPPRPDSRYGVSKAFGEALGALYADKHGLRALDPDRQFRRSAARPATPVDLAQSARLPAAGADRAGASGHPLRGRLWRFRQRSLLVGQPHAYRLGYRPTGHAEDFASTPWSSRPSCRPIRSATSIRAARSAAWSSMADKSRIIDRKKSPSVGCRPCDLPPGSAC